MPNPAAKIDKATWQSATNFRELYLKAIGSERDKAPRPGEFVAYLLALLARTNYSPKFNCDRFSEALRHLKLELAESHIGFLMSEISFRYTYNGFVSESVERAYNSLQKAEVVTFDNPTYQTFTSCFDNDTKINSLIDSFQKGLHNINLTAKDEKTILDIFCKYHEVRSVNE